MVKAVVFDMDGLMFDTETLATECWLAVGKEWGAPVDEAFLKTLVGLNMRSIKVICREHFDPDFALEDFLAQVNHRYRSVLEMGMPEKPGLRELLSWLREQGLAIGMATSSSTDTAERNLAICGLREYFDALVCGEMVKNGKPDPEIYSTAAMTLGFEAWDCAALDDSPAGIRSAHGAGLRAVMVPDKIAPTPEIEAMAVAVLDSLLEVPAWLATN